MIKIKKVIVNILEIQYQQETKLNKLSFKQKYQNYIVDNYTEIITQVRMKLKSTFIEK